eukprot:6023744-Pyramimonas_sp.AAC.1
MLGEEKAAANEERLKLFNKELIGRLCIYPYVPTSQKSARSLACGAAEPGRGAEQKFPQPDAWVADAGAAEFDAAADGGARAVPGGGERAHGAAHGAHNTAAGGAPSARTGHQRPGQRGNYQALVMTKQRESYAVRVMS